MRRTINVLTAAIYFAPPSSNIGFGPNEMLGCIIMSLLIVGALA